MNKNKLALILLILPQLLFAQAALPKTAKSDYLSPQNKDIKYDISIKKGEDVFLKTTFSIQNEKQIILLSKDNVKDEKQITTKNAGISTEQVIATQEGVNSEEAKSVQLVLVLHLDKKNKNIWSEFSTRFVEVGKEEKVGLMTKDEAKALATETTPVYKKEDNKISIMHIRNQETLFSWDDKQFTIKANFN